MYTLLLTTESKLPSADSDGSSGTTNSDTEANPAENSKTITKNISQIEALIARINDENKKTKVLSMM